MTERTCETCEYYGTNWLLPPCYYCCLKSEHPRWQPNQSERLRARVAELEAALRRACDTIFEVHPCPCPPDVDCETYDDSCVQCWYNYLLKQAEV